MSKFLLIKDVMVITKNVIDAYVVRTVKRKSRFFAPDIVNNFYCLKISVREGVEHPDLFTVDCDSYEEAVELITHVTTSLNAYYEESKGKWDSLDHHVLNVVKYTIGS
jgi:hypothetical protein